MEDKDRFVDELLDSALAQQGRAEPRTGFKGRILARVSAAHESSRIKAWKLWLAVAATAAVVVLVAVHVEHRPQSPSPQTSQAANAAPAPSPNKPLKANSEPAPAAGPATKVAEPTRSARHEKKPSRRVEAHHWPSQFPTPAPLTPEEKALVQYVRDTPPQVLSASLFKKQFLDQPVEIRSLIIPPLKIEPLALGPTGDDIQ